MNIKTILAGTLLSLPAMSFVADASGSAESIIKRHEEVFNQGNLQNLLVQTQLMQQNVQKFREAAQEHEKVFNKYHTQQPYVRPDECEKVSESYRDGCFEIQGHPYPQSWLHKDETYLSFWKERGHLLDLCARTIYRACEYPRNPEGVEITEVDPFFKNGFLIEFCKTLGTIHDDLDPSMLLTWCTDACKPIFEKELNALKEKIKAFEPCVTNLTREFKTLFSDFSKK